MLTESWHLFGLANYQQPNFEMISELTIKMQTSLLNFLSTIEYKISKEEAGFHRSVLEHHTLSKRSPISLDHRILHKWQYVVEIYQIYLCAKKY